MGLMYLRESAASKIFDVSVGCLHIVSLRRSLRAEDVVEKPTTWETATEN